MNRALTIRSKIISRTAFAALLFCLGIIHAPAPIHAKPVDIEDYTPPPMFAAPVYGENILDFNDIAPASGTFEPNRTPPIPLRRPQKFTVPDNLLKQLRAQGGVNANANANVNSNNDTLENRLITPDRHDILQQIDPQ